jgi:hypothetical protein
MTTIHRIHPTPPMRGRFHLDVCHEDPDEVVIYVVGELDIATTPVLRGSLSDLLDVDTPWSTLEVDCPQHRSSTSAPPDSFSMPTAAPRNEAPRCLSRTAACSWSGSCTSPKSWN